MTSETYLFNMSLVTGLKLVLHLFLFFFFFNLGDGRSFLWDSKATSLKLIG